MYKEMFMVLLLVNLSLQFKTAVKTQITPLETILGIDPSGWTCENPPYKEQLRAEHDIEQWIDIVKHKDGFDGDLQVLAMVKALVDKVLASVQHISGSTFVQVKHIHHQLSKHFKKLSEIESLSSWNDINDILGYVEVLNKAKSDEDKLQLATMIAGKISELIQQITEIQLQLNSIPVEIDDLYELSTRVNQKTLACKDVWAPFLEADEKAEEEKQRVEQEQEAARVQAEEEAKQREEQAIEEERRKEEEARELQELKNSVELTPEEAEALEQEAEQELQLAEEAEIQAQQELEKAQITEKEAEQEAEKEEEEAKEAAQRAEAAEQALQEAQRIEEEACVDAEEAERRLKAAQEAAEEARKKVEEAERLAEEARKTQECLDEPPLDEPFHEEFYEEEYEYFSEEEGCTDEALEDLIDTLIDAANGPSAYQTGCGYPGCQDQPIIIVVEDDEDEPQPEPQPQPEPKQEEENLVEEEIETEPTPDDDKTFEEEQEAEEEITVEEIVEEEIIVEEILVEEEEEDDDDFGRLEYPVDPPEEIQYLLYKSDDKHVNIHTQESSKWEVEVNHGSDTRIKGSTEYSYGLWTYFRYNGAIKISEKKDVLVVGGLSGDGSSRLLTLIGEGFYNFQIFDGDTTTEQQVDYGKYLDAEWIYVYFGYKEGKANGYVYWQELKLSRVSLLQSLINLFLILSNFHQVGGQATKLSMESLLISELSQIRILLLRMRLL
ncbi:unnamed protein product [Paramecium sonneborni]|uniref:Uncharacterized protein n=1 Tax=Paramecium sonneborni TaxID=65129 RepID=A0A8S1L283_9CILI|nr:unnamed protein product [Paramecium sonneborni]